MTVVATYYTFVTVCVIRQTAKIIDLYNNDRFLLLEELIYNKGLFE